MAPVAPHVPTPMGLHGDRFSGSAHTTRHTDSAPPFSWFAVLTLLVGPYHYTHDLRSQVSHHDTPQWSTLRSVCGLDLQRPQCTIIR